MRATLDWDIASIIGTAVDGDGVQTTQHDADGEEQAGVTPPQAHHFFGFWGRAPDGVREPQNAGAGTVGVVDPSRSANVLTAYEGGVGHAWDLEHIPTLAILPTPVAGESQMYSASGAFSRCYLDGSIARSTTDQGGGQKGTTVADRVSPTAFQQFGPWGRTTFDATGWRVRHSGGGRLTLGYVAGPGLPPPLNGGQSFFRAQAQIIELNGSAIHIGPTGSVVQPVVQALPLFELLTVIGAALTALQATVQQCALLPNAQAAANTSAGLVTLAIEQIATALPTLSTQTAIG